MHRCDGMARHHIRADRSTAVSIIGEGLAGFVYCAQLQTAALDTIYARGVEGNQWDMHVSKVLCARMSVSSDLDRHM